MFFRKKRYEDAEGYNRISRLVDNPDAEAGEMEQDDDPFDDEETVLLTRESREQSARQGGARPAPSMRESTSGREAIAADDSDVRESVTVVRAPDRAAPRQATPAAPVADPLPPAPLPPLTFEPPRMPLPDLALTSPQAGSASLVAKDAVWEGKLICSGSVRIEGSLRGEIETTGALFVAAEARVDGTVRARTVTLAGEIKGDLHCEERLEILPGGSARGEVDTGALVVHEGAFIESRFQMRREGA